MLYYLAPLEGITTYIYRNAYARYFGGIDKYFTPFLSDKSTASTREIRDILPENNTGIPLVPQILSNQADRFLAVADRIASYGYDTVNLNLGCPSGTVTAKKRGSGFLCDPDALDAFLYEIYEKCSLKISIKTRLGIDSLDEWARLLEIYGKYPLEELIIHVRLQQEFYAGRTHPEAYAAAVKRLEHCTAADPHAETLNGIPLCYNGDIVSVSSLAKIMEQTPLNRVMIGRGIIQNPGLTAQLRSAKLSCSAHPAQETEPAVSADRRLHSSETWRAFHDEILEGYMQIMSGDSPVLYKMKDLWTYMSRSFDGSEKCLKKLRKATRIPEYVRAVDEMFRLWE